MQQCRPARFKFNTFLAILLGQLSLLSLTMQSASAQIETVVNFQPPPMSSPGNREAGGQRSDTCVDTADTTGLVALVPDTHISLTTAASPNLLAYVPPNNAQRAELRILKEATGEAVFIGQVALPENTTPEATAHASYRYQAAIANIPLAAQPVVLEPGESYIWALMLVCNSDNRAEDIVVDVVIRRADEDYLSTLSHDVTEQLINIEMATDEVKLITYSSAGIWQDLVSELAVLMQQQPERYKPTWSELLTNQGMAAIVNAPIYESDLQSLTPEEL